MQSHGKERRDGTTGAAFLTLLALTLGAVHFLQIAIVAKGRFEFGVADIVSCESGLLFALAGGVISRRYAFAAVAGVTYAAFWALAIRSRRGSAHRSSVPTAR